MPNFTATLRTGYRDISGMVLSCRMQDIVEDSLNPGFVKSWSNKAPGIPSKPAYRLPSDPIDYEGGRFSTPEQRVKTNQPELVVAGPYRGVKFTRASQHYLQGEIPGLLPEDVRGATFCFKVEDPTADVSNNQVVYSDGTNRMRRRNGAGSADFKVGAFTANYSSGDLDFGTYLVTGTPTNLIWSHHNTFGASPAGNATQQFQPGPFYLGRDAAGNYFDGTLYSIHAWARELSPLERDFIWRDIFDDGSSGFTVNDYAGVVKEILTDATGTVNTSEIVRVRSQVSVNQYFKKVRIFTPPARVQIAASEDGFVKPDADLIGENFQLSWIDVPGAPPVPPMVFQDVGWSSVFDCRLGVEGHYCARVWRPSGGAVIIHFDVEFT